MGMKFLKKIILSFSLIVFSANCQYDSISFINHKVKKKETLFSLSKKYNLSVNDIKKYNPVLNNTILKKKMELRIPVFYISDKKIDSLKYHIHSVKVYETLWSISKKYNIEIDSLNYYNPELLKYNLRQGSKIKLPISYVKKLINDEFNEEIQIYSLKDSVKQKKEIKLGLFLPFKTNQFDFDSIFKIKEDLKKRNLKTISLDFCFGVILAYKEASELGINCEVEFFDTKNDISHLNKIIKKVKPNKFDAIIGPLIPKNFNYLSSLGYFRDTPLIAPLSTKPVKFVKNVYQSVTSKEFLRKKMYKYLDKIIDSTKNTLIIADTLNREIEKELNLRFPYSKIIRPEAEGYMSTELVDSLITDSLPNKIIFESENLALISNVTSLLNSISSEEREIHLITTKREKVYDNFNISRKHLGNINFTYADGSATFENENTINFERKYLDTFNKLPTFESLRAYDLTLDIILRLAYSKKIFFKKNNLTKYLKNSFDYKKIDKSGYSNEAFYLLMHDGYSVKEINKSEFLSK